MRIAKNALAVGDGERGSPAPARRDIEGLQGRHGCRQEVNNGQRLAVTTVLTPNCLDQASEHGCME